MRGELDGDMQLPAELADIGDAERQHRRAGDRDRAGMRRTGNAAFETIVARERLQAHRGRADPSREKTAFCEVMSISRASSLSGMLRAIQSKSCVAKPVPVTM